MDYNSNPYEDKWSDTSITELVRKRPTGITILASLQIIGVIISAILVFLLPNILDEKLVEDLFGISILQILIINLIISIPVSILLAYGLLKGEKWARTITMIFQFVNIITSIIRINLIGILIPIFIIYYLQKPYVIRYFDRETDFGKKVKKFIIAGVIIMIVLSFFTSIQLLSLRLDLLNFSDRIVSKREELLIGTWKNTDNSITLTFYSNHSCTAFNGGEYYNGTWTIQEHFYWIDICWSSPFKLAHPNDHNYYYTIEQVYLIGENLSLYSMFKETTPLYYICYKVYGQV